MGKALYVFLVVRESWMYFSYTSQQTSGVHGLSAPCCDIATPAYLGSGLGRRVGPCHDELALSYSLGRKRLGVGPIELASLAVFLAMLRVRLASARSARHFYTLSISWGMKV